MGEALSRQAVALHWRTVAQLLTRGIAGKRHQMSDGVPLTGEHLERHHQLMDALVWDGEVAAVERLG